MVETNMVRRTRVMEVVEHKRRLVELPYAASIADTVQVMAANDVVAVAVAAPTGKWTGAGGSMILTCLKPSGHSLEGLSLWTINPNTSVLEVMEPFSKGIHRALVPLESCTDRGSIVELKETSPGYQMLTQMDIVRFLNLHSNELKPFISSSVGQLGAVQKHAFVVSANMKVASVSNACEMLL
ncbi:hypothetical protein SUGI_0745340 [Cryptomeria japonica]|nr:hypothetical protein SUGI_0745340 [Cryptomeria japonica]